MILYEVIHFQKLLFQILRQFEKNFVINAIEEVKLEKN